MEYPAAASLFHSLIARASETARFPRVTVEMEFTDRHGNQETFPVAVRTERSSDRTGWGANPVPPGALVIVTHLYARRADDENRVERVCGYLAADGTYTRNDKRGSDHNEADTFGRAMLAAVETGGEPFLFDNARARGTCCFCMADLSTPESVTAGYGPQCAAKLGLPWGDTPADLTPAPTQRADTPTAEPVRVDILHDGAPLFDSVAQLGLFA